MLAVALNNEAYAIVFPTYAIIIACVWAVIVIAVGFFAFASGSRSQKRSQH